MSHVQQQQKKSTDLFPVIITGTHIQVYIWTEAEQAKANIVLC